MFIVTSSIWKLFQDFYCFLNILILLEYSQSLYNVVLVSHVQQSDSVMCVHIFFLL